MTQTLGLGEREKFLTRFADLGYASLGPSRSDPKGSEWFAKPQGESGIRQFILLTAKPRYEAFGVLVGVESLDARARIDSARSTVERFLQPAVVTSELRVLERPCLVMFDVGRAYNWKLLSLPNPLLPEQWEAQFDQLVSFLNDELWDVTTSQRLYSLIDSDAVPFDWAASQAVIRAAMLASIGKCLGKLDSDLRQDIMSHKAMIKIHMHEDKNVELLVDELVREI